MRRLRLVVLVSGRGTNLENLIAASKDGRMDADVVHVVSNRAEAAARGIAARAGIACTLVESKGVAREEHEARVMKVIDAARPDLVVLAGYMRVLTPTFIRRYLGRLVNIHPSLLPAFPGLDAQAQAALADVRITGCTTHFVTEEVDAGPILMQAAVPVPPGATPDDVAHLVRAAEHRIYPETIQLLAKGHARWEGGRVVFDVPAEASPAMVVSPEVPR
jgi:phosphoribosylglycinamide formyltransferase-1